MRVLVVEDYRPLRESLVQWLQEDGYAVDATGDGAEGLWYANRTPSPYDAIISGLIVQLPLAVILLPSLLELFGGTATLGGSRRVARSSRTPLEG